MYIETPDGGNLLMRSYARAVSGRHLPEDTSPDLPDWAAILISVALIAASAWLFYGAAASVFQFAKLEYQSRSPLAYFAAMFGAFVVARFAFYVREIRRRWWEYPPIEIGIGLGLSAVAVRPDLDPIVNLLALFAAIRVIIDGIKRFRDFRADALSRKVAA